jgi:hypothetical protein
MASIYESKETFSRKKIIIAGKKCERRRGLQYRHIKKILSAVV